jgi:hypothetical protein
MGLRALLQQKSPRLRGFIISGLCLKQKGESLTLSRSLYRCLVFSDCAHTLWISPSKAAEADATSGYDPEEGRGVKLRVRPRAIVYSSQQTSWRGRLPASCAYA